MKFTPLHHLSHRLGAGILLLAVAPSAPAVPVSPPAAEGTSLKPYVLFMRTDVAVERNKKLYPVKDVHGRSFVIADKGRLLTVPMTDDDHRLEFRYGLTLARSSASVTDLKSDRAYTPGRDPMMQRQRDAVTAEAAMGDKASYHESQMVRGFNKDFVTFDSDARMPDGTKITGVDITAAAIDANALAESTASFQAMNQAEELRQSNVTSGAYARLAADSDMALEKFDAVSVRFHVSSPVELAKPYLVIITRFHAPNDKPGLARNAVFAKALESIGSRPTEVEALQGGFPIGFVIEEVQVHLYNEGKEIPTEVAQKRVPLSREEAFEYLKIDYLRDHKDDTLTATPALGRPERGEMIRLGPKLMDAVYFVQVDESGRAREVFTDENCTQAADETVSALAGSVRFYPALKHGKATTGLARLVLSQVEL